MLRFPTRLLATLAAFGAAAFAVPASAGWVYVPGAVSVVAQVPPPPPYGYQEQELQGHVGWSEPFHMTLWRDDQRFAVRLHQGTVILPTGLTLQRGMRVRVFGHFGGDGVFNADRIVLI